jgi:glucokinase
MADLRLGIDVGGTKSLLVVVDDSEQITPDGARSRSRRVPTPRRTADQSALIEHLVRLIDDERSAAERRGDRLVSVGIGMPGLVTRTGVLRAAPNLDGVGDLDVAAGVRASVGLPVAVDNDATCATVAEWVLGAGRGVDDLVMVSLGTGIGGGIVSGGVLQRGTQGFAGEFGHMIVDPSGWECPCGRRGCWERYASGTALPALLRAYPAPGGAPPAVDGIDLTGRDVEDAARAGDRTAIEVFETFAGWVAVGLASITNLFDPSRIVLGGGVSTASDLFLDEARRRLGDLVYRPERRRLPEVVLAEFGEHAAAVGAALIGAGDVGQ